MRFWYFTATICIVATSAALFGPADRVEGAVSVAVTSGVLSAIAAMMTHDI